jgi:hypothetical protein
MCERVWTQKYLAPLVIVVKAISFTDLLSVLLLYRTFLLTVL